MSLVLPGAIAQENDELEDWQRRILEALEEAEDSGSGGMDAGPDRPGSGSARQGYVRPQPDDDAAARAAEEARRRYGGRALAVVRVGEAYRVRLLLDSGRVMTVTIAD